MGKVIEKEWLRILEQEEKFLCAAEKKKDGKLEELAGKLEEKIPPKLIMTLNEAFYKAFLLIFEKGTDVIEKTFKGEEMELEFRVNDFRMDQKASRKAIRKLEKAGKQSSLLNACVTTAEGIGLGALGIGMPDIPLFLGMLLKGIYETAASYGIAYRKKEEQVFILRMIAAGLAQGDMVREKDMAVEEWITSIKEENAVWQMEAEIRMASAALADGMLAAKFLQGIPVVGVVGGMSNPVIYRKVLKYASLKYKKRYLAEKRKVV